MHSTHILKPLRLAVLFVALGTNFLGARASGANIDIAFQPLSLAPGQTGLLEVDYSVSSPPQNLAQDEFAFTIAPSSANGLHFLDSPVAAQDPSFSALNYIFAGNSGDSAFSIPFASIGNGSDQTIYGGDSTASFGDTPVGSGLLGYLYVMADLSSTNGEAFHVNLVNDPTFTQFNDQNGNLFTFSSTAGAVSIVPEPASWVMAVLGFIAAAGCRCFRRRQTRLAA